MGKGNREARGIERRAIEKAESMEQREKKAKNGSMFYNDSSTFYVQSLLAKGKRERAGGWGLILFRDSVLRAPCTMLIFFCLCLMPSVACAAPVTKTVVILKQAAPADNISAKNTRARFRVEVVTEKADKNRGLSGRESLPADAGMLFVLGDDSRLFWMKGMNFPIDIIVIDRGMRVTGIFRDLQPCTQCPIYPVSESAAYALEINAGLAGKYGIAEGDRFILGYE